MDQQAVRRPDQSDLDYGGITSDNNEPDIDDLGEAHARVLPIAEMSETALADLARGLFDRVCCESWQTRAVVDRPSLEEQYEELRRELAEEEWVDAFLSSIRCRTTMGF